MTRVGRKIGRTRIRLATILSELFSQKYGAAVTVEPEDLWMQEGGYRSVHWDLARWGGAVPKERCPPGIYRISFCSWDRMGDCCRFGIAEPEWNSQDLPHTYDLSRNED